MGTLNIDGMLSAKRTIFYTTDNSTGTTGNLTLRTNGDNALAPSLVFSIDGVKHSMIKMFADGHFRFFNSSSSGYRNIYANTFIGNLSGNATTASALQTSRVIYGQNFDGTANVEGRAVFWGTYNEDSSQRYNYAGIQIRENDLVLNTSGSTSMGHAPAISFHWGGRCAGSLIYDSVFYFKTQAWTRASIDANLIGTASLADKLSATRYIFGRPFDGSGNVQGIIECYGNYAEGTYGLLIREAELSGTAHNSNAAAPSIQFHWSGKTYGYLLMNSSGNFYLTTAGARAYLDANVPWATSAGSADYATSAGNADTVDGCHFHWSGQGGQPAWLWGGNDGSNMYVYNPSNFSVNYANSAGTASTATRSTYAGTSWTATCTTKKWRRICYIATDIGIVGTAGILNIRSTRGNYVCNASFMITSAHPTGNSTIIQLGSMWYSTAQIRVVSDAQGNFYIEIYDNGDNVDAGIAQTYYCSWLPLTASSITVYTSATSGSTVPNGFGVRSSIAIAAGNYVVGNLITASQYGSDPNSQASILGNIYFKV